MRNDLMMERRRSRRVSVTAEVVLQVDGTMTVQRVSDISEGGAFIDTPVPADEGTELILHFALDGMSIGATARVAFSRQYVGMGIEFTSLSEGSREAIREFVAATPEPPPFVERAPAFP